MFRIGDFSRLARVTIRTLHHYDEAGLLIPAHVDHQTGYRYYAASQLEMLQRILLLKDLGFSLEEIRDVLGSQRGAEDFLDKLATRRTQLLDSIAQEKSRLRRLEALRDSIAGAAAPDGLAVALRPTPELEAHCVRRRVPQLGVAVQELFESAEATVARARARADASPLLIFHDQDYREEQVDVEICIPVKSGASSQIATRLIEALSSVACVTFQGPYERAPQLYEALLQWLERSQLRIDGPLREVYHRYGADQTGYRLPSHVLAASSAEYVTELQAPVAPQA